MKKVIKAEIEKLFKAILDTISMENDDCMEARYIVLAIDLMAVYRGELQPEGFIDMLQDSEEIEYYTNLFNTIKDEA